jgi:hypothetical protein
MAQVPTHNFSLGEGGGGRADPEAIYNLFDFQNYEKSSRNYNCNITLLATAFIYIQI